MLKSLAISTCVLLFTSVQPLSASNYWSGSVGGTLYSPDGFLHLGHHSLFIHGTDKEGNPTFQRHQIDIRGRYKPGTRVSLSSGLTWGSRYRTELEFSFLRDRIAVWHHSPVGPVFDSHVADRRALSLCVNVGGQLLEYGPFIPYSMIGIGMRASSVKDKPMETDKVYQWIVGVDLDMGFPLCAYAQHRMQRTVKKDGLHSLEVGVRLYH